MACRTLTYASEQDWPAIDSWLQDRDQSGESVEDIVTGIMREVREGGDDALVKYTRKFDSPDFKAEQLLVPGKALKQARNAIPKSDLAIIEEAAGNIREYHEAQVQHSWWRTKTDGTVLGRMVNPVDSVGLYVPGGQGGETPLISSLLMNAIPAQVAGVPEMILASPPRKDGTLNPHILAAAHLLGIEKVLCSGSAWAVAAFAYGTQSCPAVDFIAGPGNIFVTTAKRMLIGKVGIDMIAGPSEILILADTADDYSPDPGWLAADMLSQAEHDPLASSILITPDEELGKNVLAALEEQLNSLPRNEIARKSLEDWGAVVFVPDVSTGIDLVNHLAPEHFELVLKDPWPLLGAIRHAGAIFLGENSAEPVGDYFAGPNHVLPTMGTARFSSGLSVESFYTKTSLIAASPGYVQEHGAKIAHLARLEGLEAHARSVECRFKD